MTEGAGPHDDDFSLLALGTTLLRNRWRIARWAVAGMLVAGAIAVTRPRIYTATAAFQPQGTDASRSGLASLAGQFGLTIPSGNQSTSPDFYVRLLKSRVLLGAVARDTLVVPELGGRRVTMLDLLKVKGDSPANREERGVLKLASIVGAGVSKTTGIVELSVQTKWPSVSVAIANQLVSGVNDFNLRTRQGQASAERKFVENRLQLAGAELRVAEDRLQSFLAGNRQFSNSPELTFQRDRLQRDLTLQQQVFTTLTQAYEDVRIREVRDTPMITMVETPVLPTQPEPRWILQGLLLGLAMGAFAGAFLAFAKEAMRRRRREGDPEADIFVSTLGEVKGEMMGRVRRLRDRVRLRSA